MMPSLFGITFALCTHIFLVHAEVLTQEVPTQEVLTQEVDTLLHGVVKLETQLAGLKAQDDDNLFGVVSVKRTLEDLTGSGCARFWQYNCGTRCVAYYLLCDGQPDCPDGEDETPQLCRIFLAEGDVREGLTLRANWGVAFQIKFTPTWRLIMKKLTISEYFPAVPTIEMHFPHDIVGGGGLVNLQYGIFHYGQGRFYETNPRVGSDFYTFEESRITPGALVQRGYTGLVGYDAVGVIKETSRFYILPK